MKKREKLRAKRGRWRVVMFNQYTGICKEVDLPSANNLCKRYAKWLVKAQKRMNIGVVLLAEKMPKGD